MASKIVPVALCLIVLAAPFVGFESSASGVGMLMISEVMPSGDCECVTLKNYGTGQVDLSEYSLSDGEGSVTFSSYILSPGERVTVCDEMPPDWFPVQHILIFGSIAKASRFALADSGDQVILLRGGTAIDVFVYGESDDVEGWSGPPVSKVPKYRVASRASPFDTDTASDWRISAPGSTRLKQTDGFECIVTPFSFPESAGSPVFSALESAEDEILISIYSLQHPDVVSLLRKKLQGGVSVVILAEGSPVGGVSGTCIGSLTALWRSGADVSLMKASDDFRRYTYLHNKYAIVDSETVILTSENWTESSFTTNRGWGAIINGTECASYMRSLFCSDLSSEYDVVDFREAYPTSIASNVGSYTTRGVCDYPSYTANVIPVISPDNSYATMREMIDSSEVRLYSEQLSVQYTWTSSDSPVLWMSDAYDRGVDARLLVDVTFDDPNDSDVTDGYGVVSALEGSFPCDYLNGGDGFSMSHNKGVISDDRVWIGSVNWTDNSFMNNREVAFIIESEDVSDMFAELFLDDWGGRFAGDPYVSVSTKTIDGEYGTIILDASGSNMPSGTLFEWDIDGDGWFDRDGERILVGFQEGEHVCLMRATCPDGTEYEETFGVSVGKEPVVVLRTAKYLPLMGICVTVLTAKLLSQHRRK